MHCADVNYPLTDVIAIGLAITKVQLQLSNALIASNRHLMRSQINWFECLYSASSLENLKLRYYIGRVIIIKSLGHVTI